MRRAKPGDVSRNGHSRIYACVGGTLVVAVGVAGFIRARTSSPPEFSPKSTVDSTPRATVDTSLRDRVFNALARQIGSTVPQSEANGLATEAAEAFRIYRDGNAEDFASMLRRRGLELPPEYQNPRDAERAWQERTKSVKDISLDVASADVQWKVRRGQLVPEQPGALMTQRASTNPRPRGPNDVDPVAQKTDAVEVSVAGNLRAHDGSFVKGRLGLRFAKRPADGVWILVGIVIRDYPTGKAIAVPPI